MRLALGRDDGVADVPFRDAVGDGHRGDRVLAGFAGRRARGDLGGPFGGRGRGGLNRSAAGP